MKNWNLWGMDSEEINSFGKKYTYYRAILLTFMILFSLVMFYLVDSGYFIVGDVLRLFMIIIIADSIILNIPLRKGRDLIVEAYQFKKKHKKDTISSMVWNTSIDDLYTYIYRLTKTKPSKNMDTEYYIKLINKICAGTKNFSRKFMQNLDSKANDDKPLKLRLYFCEDKKNRKFLIGLEEDTVVLSNEEEKQ